MRTTVLLGAPGSGKGTQAKKIADSGVLHLSTGDILREEIKKGTPLGQKAKGFIDKGDLVPDDVMIDLIEEKYKTLSPETHVLLDGFPRTVPQAQALDKKANTSVDSAIYFKIPESELVSRLTGRRICRNCGAPFHTKFVPPKKEGVCDNCGGELYQRSDDHEDVVVNRLKVFWKQNEGLLNYYSEKNNLKEIDANRAVDAIQDELRAVLR